MLHVTMKNKQRKNNDKSQGSYTRKKAGKYWIEDCPDSLKTDAYDLMVWITRVELTDDHQEDNKVTASASAGAGATGVTPTTEGCVEVPQKGEEDARETKPELPKKGETVDQVEKDAVEEAAPGSSKARKPLSKGNGKPSVCIKRAEL
jgi:hypothetical protein